MIYSTTAELMLWLDIAIADWKATGERYSKLAAQLEQAKHLGWSTGPIKVAMARTADLHLALDDTIRRIMQYLAN